MYSGKILIKLQQIHSMRCQYDTERKLKNPNLIYR
jgi:hypothetical protein